MAACSSSAEVLASDDIHNQITNAFDMPMQDIAAQDGTNARGRTGHDDVTLDKCEKA